MQQPTGSPSNSLIELQSLEQQVVGLLETAGQVFEELSNPEPAALDINRLARVYITAVTRIGKDLNKQVHKLSGTTDYNMSSYGSAKDLENVSWETDVIYELIKDACEANIEGLQLRGVHDDGEKPVEERTKMFEPSDHGSCTPGVKNVLESVAPMKAVQSKLTETGKDEIRVHEATIDDISRASTDNEDRMNIV
eukprot:CFRG1114T1